MKGILKPAGIAAGILGLALAGWSGAHVAGSVSHVDVTTAAQQQDVAAGHVADQEAGAAPAATPEVEPTGRADVEAGEPREVEPTERPEVEPAVKPTPVSTSSTSTATFTLFGGTVTLSCTSGGSIIVDLLDPNPGFSARVEHEDDGQAVEVRFESDSHESRLQAACAGGQVQLLELREESS